MGTERVTADSGDDPCNQILQLKLCKDENVNVKPFFVCGGVFELPSPSLSYDVNIFFCKNDKIAIFLFGTRTWPAISSLTSRSAS